MEPDGTLSNGQWDPDRTLPSVRLGPGGAKGLRPSFVREQMPSARAVPLNAGELERDFRLLAEHPAVRSINTQLLPGARPGEARIDVVVTPQPRFDAYAAFANSRSPSIGGERAAVGGSVRNALFSGDLLGGELGVTNRRIDYALSYDTPILRRTFLTAHGGQNEAAIVDSQLRTLDIRSEDWNYEVGVTQRLFERCWASSAWRGGRLAAGWSCGPGWSGNMPTGCSIRASGFRWGARTACAATARTCC